MTRITDQARVVSEQSATRLPPDVIAAFGAERAAVIAAGVPAGVAEAGTSMPDASLVDSSGSAISLTEARDGRVAVVVLYRGAWCPYCNLTLREYQASLAPALEQRDARLIAISPQLPDGSMTDVEQRELTFAVLSDSGNQVATALGVVTKPAEQTLIAQRSLGLDVTAANADGTATLPMPTVVVVDAVGTIRWIDVHPDYTTRSEVEEILSAVDALS